MSVTGHDGTWIIQQNSRFFLCFLKLYFRSSCEIITEWLWNQYFLWRKCRNYHKFTSLLLWRVNRFSLPNHRIWTKYHALPSLTSISDINSEVPLSSYTCSTPGLTFKIKLANIWHNIRSFDFMTFCEAVTVWIGLGKGDAQLSSGITLTWLT